jgi:hypothetical protein
MRASDAATLAPQGAGNADNTEHSIPSDDSAALAARLLLGRWEAAAGTNRGSQRPLRSSSSMYS